MCGVCAAGRGLNCGYLDSLLCLRPWTGHFPAKTLAIPSLKTTKLFLSVSFTDCRRKVLEEILRN